MIKKEKDIFYYVNKEELKNLLGIPEDEVIISVREESMLFSSYPNSVCIRVRHKSFINTKDFFGDKK